MHIYDDQVGPKFGLFGCPVQEGLGEPVCRQYRRILYPSIHVQCGSSGVACYTYTHTVTGDASFLIYLRGIFFLLFLFGCWLRAPLRSPRQQGPLKGFVGMQAQYQDDSKY